MAKKTRRQRRTIEDQIAQLEAKIAAIKTREAKKKAKADPVLRNVAAALKAIDRALDEAEEAAHKRALNEARSALNGLLGAEVGEEIAEVPAAGRRRRRGSAPDDLAETLLAYVRSQPGQRGEQMSAAIGTDTTTMRPVMKRLIADGKVETEGQKRGMTYSAT